MGSMSLILISWTSYSIECTNMFYKIFCLLQRCYIGLLTNSPFPEFPFYSPMDLRRTAHFPKNRTLEYR